MDNPRSTNNREGVENVGKRTNGSIFVVIRMAGRTEGAMFEFNLMSDFGPIILLGVDTLSYFECQINLRSTVYEVCCWNPQTAGFNLEIRQCRPAEVKQIFIDLANKKRLTSKIEEEAVDRSTLHTVLNDREYEHLVAEDKLDSDWKELFRGQLSPDLSEEQADVLLRILMKKQEAFALKISELGFVSYEKCPTKIDIDNQPVPYQKPYPCSMAKRLIFDQVCEDLQRAGIISETTANGGAPVF